MDCSSQMCLPAFEEREKGRKEGKREGRNYSSFFWMEGILHRKLLAKVLEGLNKERRVTKSRQNV